MSSLSSFGRAAAWFACLALALCCGGAPAQAPTQAPAQAPAQAIDEQVAALAQERGRTRAMRDLVAKGAAAVPALQRVVEQANAGEVRPELPHVLRCLARIGPDATPAQEHIRQYLKEGPTEHLLAAMCAYADLAAYAPHNEPVAPNRYYDDTTFLNHARFRLPRETKSPEGLALVTAAYTQEVKVNQRVRVFQEHANPESLPTLVSIIEGDLWFQREVAAEILGRQGEDARDALDALAVALSHVHDPEAGVATRLAGQAVVLRDDFGARAAEAILRIDPDSKFSAEAHAYLIGYAADPRARMDALGQLGVVPGDDARVVRILSGWLASPPVYPEVFNALGAMGPRAAAAIPALRAVVAADVQPSARLAASALRSIEPR